MSNLHIYEVTCEKCLHVTPNYKSRTIYLIGNHVKIHCRSSRRQTGSSQHNNSFYTCGGRQVVSSITKKNKNNTTVTNSNTAAGAILNKSYAATDPDKTPTPSSPILCWLRSQDTDGVIYHKVLQSFRGRHLFYKKWTLEAYFREVFPRLYNQYAIDMFGKNTSN